MARPLRIEYPGAVYHLTSRGHERSAIYFRDDDRQEFLQCLADAVGRFGWRCYAFCLMGNHYHLLVETPLPNLSRGMRHLNGTYSLRFNLRHGRKGHLFEGRYHAAVVEKAQHWIEVCRYVVLNPVRAGLVRRAEDWPWSSYRAAIGLATAPGWLRVGPILREFGETYEEARLEYARFVRAGAERNCVLEVRAGGLVIGSEAFARTVGTLISREGPPSPEIPREQSESGRPTLAELGGTATAKEKCARDAAMRQAFFDHRYTLSEIGGHFRLHPASVSRIVNGRGSAGDKKNGSGLAS